MENWIKLLNSNKQCTYKARKKDRQQDFWTLTFPQPWLQQQQRQQSIVDTDHYPLL